MFKFKFCYSNCFCIYVVYLDAKKIKNKENKENKGYAFIVVIGCIILYNLLFIMIFIGKFLTEYTYLLFKSMTYSELNKNKLKIYPKGVNPFHKFTICSNKNILCIKNDKSKILDLIRKIGNNLLIINDKYKNNRKIQLKINNDISIENSSERSKTQVKLFKTEHNENQPIWCKKVKKINNTPSFLKKNAIFFDKEGEGINYHIVENLEKQKKNRKNKNYYEENRRNNFIDLYKIKIPKSKTFTKDKKIKFTNI